MMTCFTIELTQFEQINTIELTTSPSHDVTVCFYLPGELLESILRFDNCFDSFNDANIIDSDVIFGQYKSMNKLEMEIRIDKTEEKTAATYDHCKTKIIASHLPELIENNTILRKKRT